MSRDETHRLTALVILGGSVRGNLFEQAIGRNVMDLPLRSGETILDCWHEAARDLAQHFGLERLPVRVRLSKQSIEPTLRQRFVGTPIRIDRDIEELRGPGGTLADVAVEFPDDALLLVVSGYQVPIDPVTELVGRLFDVVEDGAVLAGSDGRPVTMFLLSCRALRNVPTVGFIDFKEQALPRMAENFEIRVVPWDRPGILSIRTHEDYLNGLRLVHAQECSDGRGSSLGRKHEPWRPIFSIVEPGARVAEGVDLLDSVVLCGGEVEEGGVVVRSIIADGGVVRAGQMVEGLVVK